MNHAYGSKVSWQQPGAMEKLRITLRGVESADKTGYLHVTERSQDGLTQLLGRSSEPHPRASRTKQRSIQTKREIGRIYEVYM